MLIFINWIMFFLSYLLFFLFQMGFFITNFYFDKFYSIYLLIPFYSHECPSVKDLTSDNSSQKLFLWIIKNISWTNFKIAFFVHKVGGGRIKCKEGGSKILKQMCIWSTLQQIFFLPIHCIKIMLLKLITKLKIQENTRYQNGDH